MAESKKLFTQEMREVTRNVHEISDKLVNAKLGVTMSDDGVWAEGLLVFYEIIKYLEEALERHKDSLIGDLLIPGMGRTAAFESDLGHYLGQGWRKEYCIRPQVQSYLGHLQQIEKENPYLLMAYVYHLYMGIFSGGQVLRKTRMLYSALPGSKVNSKDAGNAVTSFGDLSISSLKKQLKSAVNDISEELDSETREAVLQESVKVFQLNSEVIGSVSGVDAVLRRKLLKLMLVAVVVALLVYLVMLVVAPDIQPEGDLFDLNSGAESTANEEL